MNKEKIYFIDFCGYNKETNRIKVVTTRVAESILERFRELIYKGGPESKDKGKWNAIRALADSGVQEKDIFVVDYDELTIKMLDDYKQKKTS